MPTMPPLLARLDQTHWLRISVLLGPGVLATRIAAWSDAFQPAEPAAAALLLAGMAAYAAWRPAMARLFPAEAMPGSAPPAAAPARHALLVRELVQMQGGDAGLALQAIDTEAQLYPADSYLAAIERAHQRQAALLRLPSGS